MGGMEVGQHGKEDVDRGGFERAGLFAERHGESGEVCGGDRERGADGKITGKLLERKTEEVYARTTTPVTLQSNAQTKMVMGKAADVHSGAVVHVTGTVQKDHSVQAEQIVILTEYVKVQ